MLKCQVAQTSVFAIRNPDDKWRDARCLLPSNRELISASPSRKSHLAFSGLMAISSVGRVNFLHEGCEMASRRKINGRRPWIGKKMRYLGSSTQSWEF